jgi:hypothetical protein
MAKVTVGSRDVRFCPWEIVSTPDEAGKFRPEIRLACGCGFVGRMGINSPPAPEIIAKKFQQRGWEVDMRNARRCRCPSCVSAPKKEKEAEVIDMKRHATTTPTITAPPTATAAVALASVTPTPQEFRRISKLLEEHFDEVEGYYAKGWSDVRVADATQTTKEVVAKVRDQAFGALKGDPEIDALRRELADITELLDATRVKVDELERARR